MAFLLCAALKGNMKNNAKLLDAVIATNGLKNDAALSRALKVEPPVISKMRNCRLTIGCSMILRMHETFGTPVKSMREILGAAA
jgi:plasmid maintenance system antidote protein VapI